MRELLILCGVIAIAGTAAYLVKTRIINEWFFPLRNDKEDDYPVTTFEDSK